MILQDTTSGLSENAKWALKISLLNYFYTITGVHRSERHRTLGTYETGEFTAFTDCDNLACRLASNDFQTMGWDPQGTANADEAIKAYLDNLVPG